jgi:regulatory protein
MTEDPQFKKVLQGFELRCARQEMCSADVRRKALRSFEGDADRADALVRSLVENGYVDDARYAAAFVRDKVHYNHWGRRKVEQALWQKHIDEQTAQAALDEIDDSEYADMLRPLLKQKRRSTSARNDYELNVKLIKWALGRGFTMDVIRQCLAVETDENEFLD